MKTTTQTTVQQVASELAAAFVSDKRNDGAKFYKISDDAPAWIKAEDKNGDALIYRAHTAVDDRLPDDWIYESAYFMASALSERETIDEMRDAQSEIADAQVDVYNTNLAQWLAAHLNNQALCDEAVSDGLTDGEEISKTMQVGQYLALERICSSLIDSIEAEAERRDNEATD